MSASDFVHLGAGLIVPVAAVVAVLDLERAGHTVTIDGDDLAVTRGRGRAPIDPDAIAALRRWKAHCWLIVRHVTSDHSPAAADTRGAHESFAK
jgi:hypothetical protein